MKITADMLREVYACDAAIRDFEKQWPGGLDITLANARKYANDSRTYGSEIDWASETLLSGKGLRWYNKVTDKDNLSKLALAEAFWRASKMEE